MTADILAVDKAAADEATADNTSVDKAPGKDKAKARDAFKAKGIAIKYTHGHKYLGGFIAYGILSKSPVPLNLAPTVWK